ncbi:MAG: FGGY-family carbohydrate kinase [Acidimicrobiia bacterium]|nr:FGGY-family carbohydrate kinase [Acidimicrobiia bacterium]
MLAVDLGTGGPKVAVVTTDGVVLAHTTRTCDLVFTPDDGVEQDPAAWWKAIVDGAREVLADDAVAADRVVAVAVTSQWMGTVAVDEHGEHLGNALIWMDARGAPHVRQLVSGRLGGRASVAGYDPVKLRSWLRLTGGVPSLSGKDPVGHIAWIRHNEPERYAATKVFLDVPDYLNLRLCGRASASFDTAVGFWATDNRDLGAVRWDEQLVSWIDVDPTKLPDLLPTGSVVGTLTPEAAEELGLGTDVSVVTATGDTASAAIGAGTVRDLDAHLYVGTSSWLSCHTPTKRTDLRNNITSLPAGVPGRYWVATEQDTAGKCLTWLAENVLYPDDGLGPPMPPDVLERCNEVAARVPAGSNGVVFTPWLNGERTPVDDHTIRAGWHHLGLTTTRADLVRATFEGVALNARWMLEAAERFSRTRFEHVTFVGGGARSELWCQIMADVLDRPIRQVADPVLANVRGAALSAAVTLGHLRWPDVEGAVTINHTYRPDRAHRAVYDEHFAALVAIYRKNRGIHRRLTTHAADS